MITISQLKEVTPHALDDLNRLVGELRGETQSKGTVEHLKTILHSEHISVFVAKDEDAIVGVAFLFAMQKIGKCIGYVEDVVVDPAYRGQKLGEKLMQAIIERARDEKVTYLYLTSKPEREAANHLYQKLGFEIVKTNPYRLRL